MLRSIVFIAATASEVQAVSEVNQDGLKFSSRAEGRTAPVHFSNRAPEINQESPRQTTPKKGPKRKVHEFRPIFVNSGGFPWENKHDSH